MPELVGQHHVGREIPDPLGIGDPRSACTSRRPADHDVDGHRITAFATNTRTGPLADLELRHRRRAHCEDRIRLAKDTGLMNLPLHGFAQNQIWCAIVALAPS